MIARMKKLTILASDRSREALLRKLRKAGVVHVKNINVPVSEDIARDEDKKRLLAGAINILDTYKAGAIRKRISPLGETEALKLAAEVHEKCAKKEALLRDIGDIKGEIERLKPWGIFDPSELDAFKADGIFVWLYRLRKNDFSSIPRGYRDKIRIIRRKAGYVYFAHISRDSNDKLAFDEIKHPEKSIIALKADQKGRAVEIEEINSFCRKKTIFKEVLDNEILYIDKRLNFLNVRHGMGEEERFVYIQGFCPESSLESIIDIAKAEKAGYLIEEPEDPYQTPTLITNPHWVEIVSPVFKFMNTHPGYREFDISLPFLIFFSLFFAMLIGDAGYGLLFIAITRLARRKAGNIPQEPFKLMYLLGAMTTLWGAITGTWFGVERIAQLPVFRHMVINSIDSFNTGNQDFMIYLCFIIGALHLSVAHIMQAARTINSPICIAQAGWVFVIWGLFFTAGTLVLGRPFPNEAAYILAIGSGLILLFSNFQRNFIKGVLTTLGDLPLKIISSFSDVVSYLRLFAVGYASVIMAKSFNDMALSAGFGSIASGLGAALILFLGHTLNIVLGFMAVIVHGIRLNMLEFSGHLGMEWSGREYKPFKE